MSEKNLKESRMATEPVPHLMRSLGTPIVISMMLQAAYNIVDSAFLSNMKEAGEEALTALGLAFPIQLLMVAVAIGTGVGTNALLAKTMGQGNREKGARVVGNAGLLGIIIYFVFLLVGWFGVPAYVQSQSAGGTISEIVLGMAIDYLRICCCLSMGIVFFSVYEKTLQALGRSMYSTIAQITGAVFNIVFDPIMIYGLFGCPEMGVKGAAYATVLGQIVSAIMVFVFHLKLDKEISHSARYMKPDIHIIGEIYAIGVPAIISQALLTVMTYGMNIILAKLPEIGENAVTVYSLYCKIQQLLIFAAVGMRDTITPIVSYSFGRGDRKRIQEGIRCGLIDTSVLMLIGTAAVELLAGPLTKFFALSDTTSVMCMQCIRIASIPLLAAGICVAFQGVFQAIECGIQSLLISVGRQVLFILPVAYLLGLTVTGAGNSANVWWTFTIGECLTLVCAVLMYFPARKKKLGY